MLWFNRVVVRARRKFTAMGATLEVAAKGGNIIGDLPPYEAFQIGGANSVRGYPEGGVGTGRCVSSLHLKSHLIPA
jgi:outer membrane protein insertion porin family